MKIFKRSLSLTIVILALLVWTPAWVSASEIVPGRSCNGIRIGDTQEAVKVHLGAPAEKHTISGSETWTYYLCDRGIIMGIQWNSQRKVQGVNLLSMTIPPSDKVRQWARNTNTATSKGITLGTSLRDVTAKMGQPYMKDKSKHGIELVYKGMSVYVQDDVVFYLRVTADF
ncbi:MAG: hypothetical protein Q4F00_03820 [bacterium]|nr:hypothetical protein [bacterium]